MTSLACALYAVVVAVVVVVVLVVVVVVGGGGGGGGVVFVVVIVVVAVYEYNLQFHAAIGALTRKASKNSSLRLFAMIAMINKIHGLEHFKISHRHCFSSNLCCRVLPDIVGFSLPETSQKCS